MPCLSQMVHKPPESLTVGKAQRNPPASMQNKYQRPSSFMISDSTILGFLRGQKIYEAIDVLLVQQVKTWGHYYLISDHPDHPLWVLQEFPANGVTISGAGIKIAVRGVGWQRCYKQSSGELGAELLSPWEA
ncbi:MAG: hypothetical protein Q9199_000109 [Rusavskia elegans]